MNNRHTARLVGAVGLSLLAGLALGHALVLRASELPELALRLLALCTLPIPLWTLDDLTTPQNWPAQRLLGQSAVAAVGGGVRRAIQRSLILLLVPLGMGVTGQLHAVPELVQLALWLISGIVLVQGAALVALLAGLRMLGDPTWRLWSVLGGGGAFGPAESAPLLYLPAAAWVAGQVVPLVWLAVWTEHPERLTPTHWWLLPAVALAVAVLIVRTQWQRVLPHLHAGLRTAELAHATRFLQNDGLVPPPAWVSVWQRPHTDFVITAWYRTWPIAVPVGVAVPLLVGWLLPSGAAVVTVIAELGVLAWQVHPLRHHPAWHAVQWLGQRVDTRQQALRAAILAVLVPSVIVWGLQGVIG